MAAETLYALSEDSARKLANDIAQMRGVIQRFGGRFPQTFPPAIHEVRIGVAYGSIQPRVSKTEAKRGSVKLVKMDVDPGDPNRLVLEDDETPVYNISDVTIPDNEPVICLRDQTAVEDADGETRHTPVWIVGGSKGGAETQELWLCDAIGQEFIAGNNTWKPTAPGQTNQLRWTGASRTANTTAFRPHRAQLIPNRYIGVKILEDGDYEVGYKANPVWLSGGETPTSRIGSWDAGFKSYLFVDRAGAPFEIPCSLHQVQAVGDNVPLDSTSFFISAGDADSLCVVSLLAGDIVSVIVDCTDVSEVAEVGWMFLAETSWMHIRKLPPLLFESALTPDNPTTATGAVPDVGPAGPTIPTIQPRSLVGQFIGGIFVPG